MKLALTVSAGLAAATAAATPEDEIFDGFIVRSNDSVSFQLSLGDALGNLNTLFDGGPSPVEVGTLDDPQSVGRITGSTTEVNVGWDEFFDISAPGPGLGFASQIRFDIATSNGDPFASADDFNNGFQFIQWEIGDHLDPVDQLAADPIGFRPTVTDVFLVEATAVFFEGDIVQNTINYGFTLDPDWDGTDAVLGNIFSLTSTTNRIELTYEYTPIPVPATLPALLGAAAFASRRRRG
ncbi:MAG: hypothetical protein AAGF47_10730 [Planctomycetota bacterium]